MGNPNLRLPFFTDIPKWSQKYPPYWISIRTCDDNQQMKMRMPRNLQQLKEIAWTAVLTDAVPPHFKIHHQDWVGWNSMAQQGAAWRSQVQMWPGCFYASWAMQRLGHSLSSSLKQLHCILKYSQYVRLIDILVHDFSINEWGYQRWVKNRRMLALDHWDGEGGGGSL